MGLVGSVVGAGLWWCWLLLGFACVVGTVGSACYCCFPRFGLWVGFGCFAYAFWSFFCLFRLAVLFVLLRSGFGVGGFGVRGLPARFDFLWGLV